MKVSIAVGFATLAILASVGTAVSAQSTTPDPSTCADVQVGGKRFMRCPDGRSYEWQTTTNGRSIMVRIQVMTNPYDADRLRAAEQYNNLYGGYYRYYGYGHPDRRFGRSECEVLSQSGRRVVSENCERARRGYY